MKKSFIYSLVFAALFGTVDLITKQIALSSLSLGEPVYVLPILNWTLAFNKGVAFSFLHNVEQGFWLISVFTFCVMVYIIYLLYNEKSILMSAAFSLILGGALGNFLDRIMSGAVVDFISFHYSEHYFAIFNVADIFINLGVYLIIYDFFRKKKNG